MTTPGNVLLSLYEGGKAVPAKVASWVRESVGSCASGVGKTLKRDEMARVVAAMYPDLPAEFLQKAAKPSLCLLLGDEIVGRTISGLCRQGLAGGPDTQRRLIEIVSTLTQQPAASLVALSREALCSLAANASSTKQRAGAMHAAKLLDPLAGVDWSKVGAQASSALSAAARGGRAAFDASKVIGEQLYDGTNAVLQSPVTRAAARMAGQAAMAGGRMAGQAAMAGGRMAGRAAMDMVAPPPFEIHGVTQHRAYQVALDSAHRMRSDRIASAMNPYTGVEKGKAPKVSRAMRRDGNPYVGYGNAGYLGSKRTSTAAAAAARGGSGSLRGLVRGLGIGLGRGRRIGSGSGASGSGGGGGGSGPGPSAVTRASVTNVFNAAMHAWQRTRNAFAAGLAAREAAEDGGRRKTKHDARRNLSLAPCRVHLSVPPPCPCERWSPPDVAPELVCRLCGDSSAAKPLDWKSLCKACRKAEGKKFKASKEGYFRNQVHSLHKTNRRSGRRQVSLTARDLAEIWDQQGGLCAITALEMTHAPDSGPGPRAIRDRRSHRPEGRRRQGERPSRLSPRQAHEGQR
eukprot:jgi/Mesvir1/29795/Mv19491-RA.1